MHRGWSHLDALIDHAHALAGLAAWEIGKDPAAACAESR